MPPNFRKRLSGRGFVDFKPELFVLLTQIAFLKELYFERRKSVSIELLLDLYTHITYRRHGPISI